EKIFCARVLPPLKPLVFAVLGAACLFGQSAIEKQRASVRRQAHVSGSVAGFFTIPWANALAAPPAVQAQGDCDPMPGESLDKLISTAAEREGVNPKLVRA